MTRRRKDNTMARRRKDTTMARRRKDTTMARRNMTKGMTLQWPEETWQKDKQCSTKHYTENWDFNLCNDSFLFLGLWCLIPLSTIVHFIMAVYFIGGGHRSTQRNIKSFSISISNILMTLKWNLFNNFIYLFPFHASNINFVYLFVFLF